MKNFVKKLSFVLASAMVVTSLYAPANAQAAAKDGIILKGKAIKSKSIFVGGEKLNFDYKIGKLKNKGAMGKWSTSDSSVAKVDKNGVVTAVGTGKATLMYKVKKNKNVKKSAIYKVSLTAFARATELTIPASDKAISLKIGEKKEITPVLKDKVDGVKNTYKLFAKVDNATDVAISVMDNMKVVVEAKNPTATSAAVTVFAAQKNDQKEAWNNKYMIKDSFMVDVKANLEAKQTAANKITVMGTDLTADAKDYEVKNEKGVALDIEATVDTTTAGEAVLSGKSKQIVPGKYTLSFKKGTPVEFMIEKSEAKEIVFSPEDQAILAADKKTAKIYYKVVDQFGSDVTKEYASTNRNVTANRPVKSEKPGEIEVRATVETANSTALGSDEFRPGFDTVMATVTIISGSLKPITKTQTFKVNDESKVAKVEYVGIWDMVKRTIVKTVPADADRDKVTGILHNYKLLLKSEDQFGKPFYDKTGKDNPIGAAQQVQVILNGTTGLIAVTNDARTEDVKNEKYLVYKLRAAGDLRQGAVDVKTFVVNNGESATGSFEVTPTKEVAKIIVKEPLEGVYAGQVNYLDYELLDGEGNKVTEWKKIKVLNDSKYLKNFNDVIAAAYGGAKSIVFVRDLEKNTIKLEFRPSIEPTNNQAITQVLTFVSPKNEFTSAQIRVNPRKHPVAISRINDVDRGVTRDKNHGFSIKASDLVYQDQYGYDMNADQVANYLKHTHASLAKLRVWVGELPADDKAYSEAIVKGSTLVDGDFIAPSLTTQDIANLTSADSNTKKAALDKLAKEATDFEATAGYTDATDFNKDGKIIDVKPKNNVNADDKTTFVSRVSVQLVTKNSQNEYKPVSTYSFNIYNALIDNLYNVAVNDLPVLPARDLDQKQIKALEGNSDAINTYKGVSVTARYDGAKIKMFAKDDYEVMSAMNDKETVLIPDMKYIPYGKDEAEAGITVYVHKRTPEHIAKNYKYSKEPRRINSMSLADKTVIKIGTPDLNTVKANGGNSVWTEILKSVTLKDQYDLEIRPLSKNADMAMVNQAKTSKLNQLKPVIEVLEYDDKELFVKNNGSVDTKIAFVGMNTASQVTIRFTFPTAKKSFEFICDLVQGEGTRLNSMKTVDFTDNFDAGKGWADLKTNNLKFYDLDGNDITATIVALTPKKVTFKAADAEAEAHLTIDNKDNATSTVKPNDNTKAYKVNVSIEFTKAEASYLPADKTVSADIMVKKN